MANTSPERHMKQLCDKSIFYFVFFKIKHIKIKRNIKGGDKKMNSPMEQFFKFLLAFVMVIILGTAISNYLDKNYSSFQIEETSDNSGKKGDK